ncbi:glycosyltransferase family 2 protein [Kineococcus aurantiacus]|uniref:Glycosyltransferase, GT2 family n=1 Tax=Kineococcus aurantiacus TaxID=37633 RepID=A0A7Y9DPR2_9ACTN|nr:hypothetical protein [Kineococcus aurantiacus]NYD24433.1 hypothetical protein [Kineococcus aurantiacus]
MSGAELPTVGLAITTIGRPALAGLLRSAAESLVPPVAVAVADQSPPGTKLPTGPVDPPYELRVVPSEGGASAGRNDAVRALLGRAEVLGFPNDDSSLPAGTLGAVAAAFRAPDVVAVACTLVEQGTPRFQLPPAGTALDDRSVWRAIEPSMFIRAAAFDAVGGFRADLGTGAPTPWQSGEGTDLLLRLMSAGGRVLSRPDLEVDGPGERRSLAPDALVRKHRAYARGTGHVYRSHPYSSLVRWRTVAGPWLHPASHDPDLRLSLRLAIARSVGRVEGLLGRVLPGSTQRWQ